MRRAALIGLVCVLGWHLGTAYALRCGTEIVSEKDRKFEVVRKCGDPISVESWTVYAVVPYPFGHERFGHRQFEHRHRHDPVPGETIVPVLVEEWVYNFGPHRLMHLLRFENGYLVKIGTLGYGY